MRGPEGSRGASRAGPFGAKKTNTILCKVPVGQMAQGTPFRRPPRHPAIERRGKGGGDIYIYIYLFIYTEFVYEYIHNVCVCVYIYIYFCVDICAYSRLHERGYYIITSGLIYVLGTWTRG